jgi:hypothetical protein
VAWAWQSRQRPRTTGAVLDRVVAQPGSVTTARYVLAAGLASVWITPRVRTLRPKCVNLGCVRTSAMGRAERPPRGRAAGRGCPCHPMAVSPRLEVLATRRVAMRGPGAGGSPPLTPKPPLAGMHVEPDVLAGPEGRSRPRRETADDVLVDAPQSPPTAFQGQRAPGAVPSPTAPRPLSSARGCYR